MTRVAREARHDGGQRARLVGPLGPHAGPPLRTRTRNTPPGPRTTWSGAAAPIRGRRSSCQPTGRRSAMTASTDPPALVGPSPVITASRRDAHGGPSTYRSSHIETARTKSADVLGAGSQGALERATGGLAAHGEDDPLQAAAGVQVAADLLDLDLRPPRRAGSRRRRCRRPRGPASGRRARRPAGSVAAVARRMMSAEVGPPSSIVAAWMTQRAGQRRPRSSRPPRPARPARARSLSSWIAGAAGARDRARHAAAVQQPRVGRVGDGVDLEGRDVGVEDLDRGRHRERHSRADRGRMTRRSSSRPGGGSGQCLARTWT